MTLSSVKASDLECSGQTCGHGPEYARINAGTRSKENPVMTFEHILQEKSGLGDLTVKCMNDNQTSVNELVKVDTKSFYAPPCHLMAPRQSCQSQPNVSLAIARGVNHNAPSSSAADYENVAGLYDARRKTSPKMVEIFSTAETSCLGGRPPLAPSRLRKMQLSGSRIFDSLQRLVQNSRDSKTERSPSASLCSSDRTLCSTSGLKRRFSSSSGETHTTCGSDVINSSKGKYLSGTEVQSAAFSRSILGGASANLSVMKRSVSLSDMGCRDQPLEEGPPLKQVEKKLRRTSVDLHFEGGIDRGLRTPSPSTSFLLLVRFNSLKCCWVASCRRDPGPDLESLKRGFEWDHIGGGCSARTPRLYADSISSNGALHSVESSLFGPAAVSQFIAICAEQDRLRTLFVSEVSRSLGGTVRRAAGRINNPLAAHCDDGYSRKSSTVEQIVRKFEKTMIQQLERQEHDLRWAVSVDRSTGIHALEQEEGERYRDRDHASASEGQGQEQGEGQYDGWGRVSIYPPFRLTFRHRDMFRTALLFNRVTRILVCDAYAESMDLRME